AASASRNTTSSVCCITTSKSGVSGVGRASGVSRARATFCLRVFCRLFSVFFRLFGRLQGEAASLGRLLKHHGIGKAIADVDIGEQVQRARGVVLDLFAQLAHEGAQIL